MKYGIVGRMSSGIFRYQGWPTLCKDENHVLYVAASAHRLAHICPFGKNVLYVSRDNGCTWSQPTVINDTPFDDRDAGLLFMGEGKMLLTSFHHPWSFYLQDQILSRIQKEIPAHTEGLLKGMLEYQQSVLPDTGGSFVRLSNNGGNSWEPAIQIPITSPHGPIERSDGSLLFLGKEFYSGKYPSGAILAFESCDGMEWNFLSQLELPDGCGVNNICEPYAIELKNGVLLGALRGEGQSVDHGFTIYLTYSFDRGKNWTKPKPTGICGSPPHLLQHSSGAVILTYARRAVPYGQCARISYDNGETFGEEIILDSRACDADIGYPSTVELPNGKLLSVYYQKYEQDEFCSVLSTEWELPN